MCAIGTYYYALTGSATFAIVYRLAWTMNKVCLIVGLY
jgi:hypothetical protein